MFSASKPPKRLSELEHLVMDVLWARSESTAEDDATTQDRTMTSQPATRDSYPYQNEPIWSRSERAIARKAFDVAPGQDLHEVIQQAKRMANEIQKSSDLWNLEHQLTQRRKRSTANTTFAVRALPDVLGRPLYGNRLMRKICADYARTS